MSLEEAHPVPQGTSMRTAAHLPLMVVPGDLVRAIALFGEGLKEIGLVPVA